jgi:hypothetical protein
MLDGLNELIDRKFRTGRGSEQVFNWRSFDRCDGEGDGAGKIEAGGGYPCFYGDCARGAINT